jgi:hypothetical protein
VDARLFVPGLKAKPWWREAAERTAEPPANLPGEPEVAVAGGGCPGLSAAARATFSGASLPPASSVGETAAAGDAGPRMAASVPAGSAQPPRRRFREPRCPGGSRCATA